MLWFGVLAAVCGFVYYRSWAAPTVKPSAEFASFQRLFFAVYLTMMMADWMQGPYVYALYDHYGFSKGQIGQLFIVGFGSSMVFGTVVGGFADKYGRKLNCLLFCILYGISCITKHFNSFTILMIGRLREWRASCRQAPRECCCYPCQQPTQLAESRRLSSFLRSRRG